MTDERIMEIIEDMQENELFEDVITEILEDSEDYNGDTLQERLKGRLKDIQHGLSSGIVGRLIHYTDTTAFFQKYRQEIGTLLTNLIEDTGCGVHELFRDYDKEDPFFAEQYNQNLMAWFAYEEIAHRLYSEIDR